MNFGIVVFSAVLWCGGVVAWWIWGERRLSSPVFLYLISHLFSFVLRPWLIYHTGDQSYLRTWIQIWPYPEDHAWALWQANMGLVMFTLGGLLGEGLARGRPTIRRTRMLDRRVVTYVGLVMLVLAVGSFLRYGVLPGQRTSDVIGSQIVTMRTTQGYLSISSSSAYLTSFHIVTVGVFVAWIAFLGFRWYYVPYLALFFSLMIYQGYARTTYVLGGVAIVLALMSQRGRRWPSGKAAIVLLAFTFSFLAGKGWLQNALLRGTNTGVNEATTNASTSISGQGDLFINYDMLVAVTYLVPRYADHTNVQLYFRPLYFWIPRAIWPTKPIYDFAAAYLYGRVPEIHFEGLTVTLVGESYLAFGLGGVIVLMFGYGLFFNYVHVRTLAYPAASVERVFGIAFVVALFQVYRDGVVSLNQYLLYYFGPCAIMWVVTVLVGQMRDDAPIPPGRPAPRPLPRS